MSKIYKRNVFGCILLSAVTLGIYTVYWMYLQVKNIRMLKNEPTGVTREMLLILFVPFYWTYWAYARGKTVRVKVSGKGIDAKSHEILFLVISLLCPFLSRIAVLAVIQRDMNRLPYVSDKETIVYSDYPFSVRGILDRMENDLSSMGYAVQTEFCDDGGFRFTAKKDLTPLDFVLGRQQRLRLDLTVYAFDGQKPDESRHGAQLFVYPGGPFGIGPDKVFCFLIGPFLFFISWIFMFLCFGNQKNAAQIAETSLRNFVDKLKNEKEKTE